MSSDNEKYSPLEPDYIKLTALSNKISEIVYPREGHDYNTSCDALWKAAKLAFDFVAHEIGVTGAQAEMAAIHLYGQILSLDGPYMVMRLEKELYPQYDCIGDYVDFRDSEHCREWLRESAKAKIAQYDGEGVGPAPRVRARWEELARD